MLQEAKTTVVVHHQDEGNQMAKPKAKWYDQMDGLRFIAVTAVLIEHFASFIGEKFHLGFFGVDLFFVISGFLITEGLLAEGETRSPKAALRRFYLKRFLRIFPIYYLVLILSIIFYRPFFEIAIWSFTYTINYYPAITGNWVLPPYGHLWSLAVEEQFYFFWPCLVLFLPRKFFFPALCIIFVSSLIYFLLKHNWLELPSRMYSLCLGAFLAFLKTKFPDKYALQLQKKVTITFVLAVIVYFFDMAVGISIFSFGLVFLASNNAYKGWFKKFLQNRTVAYVGKISYGVYLYHMFIAFILGKYLIDPLWSNFNFDFFPVLQYHKWLLELPLYFLLSVLIAHISFVLIEKPILKLKTRIK